MSRVFSCAEHIAARCASPHGTALIPQIYDNKGCYYLGPAIRMIKLNQWYLPANNSYGDFGLVSGVKSVHGGWYTAGPHSGLFLLPKISYKRKEIRVRIIIRSNIVVCMRKSGYPGDKPHIIHFCVSAFVTDKRILCRNLRRYVPFIWQKSLCVWRDCTVNLSDMAAMPLGCDYYTMMSKQNS